MGKGTKRNRRTIETWTVAAQKTAATTLQHHWMGGRVPRRNELARTACVVRGGPSPAVHQRKSARNIASAIAATGTLRVRSNRGHTFAATSATTTPEMMARNNMGSFAQRPGARSCVAMGDALGGAGANVTLPNFTIAASNLAFGLCEAAGADGVNRVSEANLAIARLCGRYGITRLSNAETSLLG